MRYVIYLMVGTGVLLGAHKENGAYPEKDQVALIIVGWPIIIGGLATQILVKAAKEQQP